MKSKLFALTGLLVLSSSSYGQSILLNDQFTDSSRTIQLLNDSAAWYIGGRHGLSGSASTGAYVVTSGVNTNPGSNKNFSTHAYFTNSGAQSLGIGDMITLSFAITFDLNGNPAASGFRFGLFNSGGTRVTADNSAENGSAAGFNNDLGYTAWASLGQVGALNLYEKTAPNDLNVSGSASTLRAPGTNTNIFDATSTTGTFSITRTAVGLDIVSTIAGGSVSYSDLTASTFAFDEIYIFGAGTPFTDSNPTPGGFTLDNVNVTYTVVPEPSTYGLLVLSGLVLIMIRRRRLLSN